MRAYYRHTQVGYVVLAGLVAGAVVVGAAVLLSPERHAAVPIVLVLALCMALFPTLTAEVERGHVRASFGFGLIRRTISLSEIESVSVVRNPWYYGWGLRWIPGGWLWNVSGLDAVELRLRGGRVFRIGTDEPESLSRAILNALGPAE